MRYKPIIHIMFALGLLALISACGGGGGGGEPPPGDTNPPPAGVSGCVWGQSNWGNCNWQ